MLQLPLVLSIETTSRACEWPVSEKLTWPSVLPGSVAPSDYWLHACF